MSASERSPAAPKCVNVYAYGSEDGTNYGDNASGSAATLALRFAGK